METKKSLADDLLDLDDIKTEEVKVPEWGGRKLLVRGLIGDERDTFEESIIEVTGEGKKQKRKVVMSGIRAKLLVRCIVNDKGERVFTDAHISALGKKSAAALDRLFEVAKRLSGIGEEEVEELLGNSEPAPSASST